MRLLYSLKDIQIALSAAAFLAECEPDIAISKIELRRFKCYETTAIIAYTRPFSETSDGFPKLSMKMIGVRLDVEEQKLHDELIFSRFKFAFLKVHDELLRRENRFSRFRVFAFSRF